MTKLNNKGQSLALFIVIIPVLILVGIYVIDIGNLKYNENKLENVNYLVVNEALTNIDKVEIDDIKKLIEENGIKDVNSNIIMGENEITIKLEKKVKGTFGTIINKNLYNIKSTCRGSLQDGKVVIERVD